ncbi:MAG: hypothetical protein WC216_09050 [Gallionella sp.]|jgi:hypothetical protein
MKEVEILTGEFGERIGQLSLADAISQNHTRLENSFNRLYPDKSYDDCKQEVVDKIDEEQTAYELDIKLRMNYLARHGPNYRSIPFLLSIAYCIESQRAFEKGNTEEAWAFIPYAESFAEMAEEDFILEAERLDSVARAGGQGRAAKFKPAKDEAIRLLKENRPEDGWKNDINYAIKLIEDDLCCFIEKEKIDLNWGELNKTLKRWLKVKNSEIRTEFER